jgi:DNA polymerase-3 subunit gamma/tau
LESVAIFRKFRPQKFSEVVGQKHIVQTLANAVKESRVASSYLFSGPRGTGKTSVARILAKALNCEKGMTPEPCGKCFSCRGIADGSFVDVLEIDAASNRGIDEIRAVRERVHFSPAQGRYKVYIIDEVHMLTKEAFNALLKTLEEPPLHVVFVLATTEVYKVPLTILSRCQRFDFRRIPSDEVVAQLSRVAKEESINLTKEALWLVARHAQGSLRDALVFLEQLASFSGQEIGIDEVAFLLGKAHPELLKKFSEGLAKKDLSTLIQLCEELYQEGRDFNKLTRDLMDHFHELFLVKEGHLALEGMVDEAKHFNSQEILSYLDILADSLNEMRYADDNRLLLERALVRMVNLEKRSLEALEARLSRLEQALEKQAERRLRGALETVEVKEQRKVEKKIKVERKVEGSGRAKAHPSPASDIPTSPVDLAKVKRLWPQVMAAIRKQRVSLYALLLECEPIALENNTLTLGFRPTAQFHRDEVDKLSNRQFLLKVLEEKLGIKIELSLLLTGVSEVLEEPSAASVDDFVAEFQGELVDEFLYEEER